MDLLRIPHIAIPFEHPKEGIQEVLSPLPAVAINQLSWDEYGYKPEVSFKIAHTPDGILLQYDVLEEHVTAIYRHSNDPVYKDSCVEFFISFDGERYYNLEFNCLGTGLVGYGMANKQERVRLPAPLVGKVKCYSKINARSYQGNLTHWQLMLHIPFEVFCHEQISSLTGMVCTANFYKCGDELPVPHFVSWKKIRSESPNFHRPDFFGRLVFE